MDLKKGIIFLAVRMLRIIMLVYLGMVLLMASCQRRFIYYPSLAPKEPALRQAKSLGMEPWFDYQGDFAGWRRRAADSETQNAAETPRRALVFHGNAGHALQRMYYMDGFDSVADGEWDVILFEYPGYGVRSGQASERSITRAALAAFKTLIDEHSAPLYLVGESLGSGPACRLASEHAADIAGIWLVTPFSSLLDAARFHYPFLPVRWLLRDRYDNVAGLQEYRGRLVVLTAGRDAVVPEKLGRRLYESAVTPHKRWIRQPDADHNSLDLNAGSRLWAEVVGFWTEDEIDRDIEVNVGSEGK